MCGRFTLTVDLPTIINQFKAIAKDLSFEPRYNIAPGQEITVIMEDTTRRRVCSMRWGLIPHWAKDHKIGYKMINARGETIDEKPSFRHSFTRRRCLIPTDGFFEWRKENNLKQPYRITLPGQPVFAFAGIWDQWVSPSQQVIHSCSIITTTASEALQPIHHRMPVILSNTREYDTWLQWPGPPAGLKELLRPFTSTLEIYPVSTAVNSPRADHPQLIKRIDSTSY